MIGTFMSTEDKNAMCPERWAAVDRYFSGLFVSSDDALEAAVLAAYGFSAKKDLLAQLLALNLEVAARIEKGEPVTAPGVPKNFPDAKKLVTEDCIRPPLAVSADGSIGQPLSGQS